MLGWMGKILTVNLAKGKAREEPLDPFTARAYIGGRGLEPGRAAVFGKAPETGPGIK